MHVLSRLRRRVEPFELAAALRRSAYRSRLVVRAGAVRVPNRFVLSLSSRDAARLFPYREALSAELAQLLSEDAAAAGWSFPGPVRVELVESPSLPPGAFEVLSRVEPTPPPAPTPAPAPAPAAASRPPAPPSSLPSAGSTSLRLRVRTPAGTFERTLPVGSFVLGRASGVDLELPDPAVSRRHGRLEVSSSGASYEDLGSANGSRLNGRRVGTAALSPGDVLELGSTRLELALR